MTPEARSIPSIRGDANCTSAFRLYNRVPKRIIAFRGGLHPSAILVERPMPALVLGEISPVAALIVVAVGSEQIGGVFVRVERLYAAKAPYHDSVGWQRSRRPAR
jgi:hypothetical protein